MHGVQPDMITDAIRAIVREEIARVLGDAKPNVYSSRGPLPQGWSRRRFLERVRTMPEARRIGGKRGRGVEWQIDRADFDATMRASVERIEKPAAPVVSIDSWLSSAGYRATATKGAR